MNWSVALRLGRVSNLSTVWTNVLAGACLSGAVLDPGLVAALMLAMSLFYVAGMYFNDAFDAGYDRIHRPGRPIPAGAVSLITVFVSGAAFILAGLAILLLVGLGPAHTGFSGLAGGVALCVAIIVYDIWHKDNPLGPVVMGLCRALVYGTVAASLAGRLPAPLLGAAAMALCYLIGLTYAAKQEDLVQPGNLWPLLFLAAPLVYGAPVALQSGIGALVYAGLFMTVVYAVHLMRRQGRAAIPRVVGMLIAGICLLDALFVVAAGHPMLGLLAACGFAATLLFQRVIPGT